jgi:hypothetical protein
MWSKMYIGFHVKRPLFVSDINETWIFSTCFRETLKYQISWKSVRWEPSCCMRTDRHDEANSRFSQFCELTQKSKRHFTGTGSCSGIRIVREAISWAWQEELVKTSEGFRSSWRARHTLCTVPFSCRQWITLPCDVARTHTLGRVDKLAAMSVAFSAKRW